MIKCYMYTLWNIKYHRYQDDMHMQSPMYAASSEMHSKWIIILFIRDKELKES